MMAQAGWRPETLQDPTRPAGPRLRRMPDPRTPAVAAPSGETWRVFFALDASPALRERTAAHAALWRWSPQARLVAPRKLHLTLVFIAALDSRLLPRLLQLGAEAAACAHGCALVLDRARLWPGGIAHLAPSSVPQALLELHEALLDGVLRAGAAADRRAWKPHLTLARRAQDARPPAHFEGLRWQPRSLSLQRSLPGSGDYLCLGRWRFGGTGGPGA